MFPKKRVLDADACCPSVDAYAESYDVGIEPDDNEVSDTVTVIWKIE